jgi:hypothetical protein
MSASYNTTEYRKCLALVGSACTTTGPPGPAGPGVTPLYGSFLSSTSQSATTVNPVAITYSERTIGSINTSGGTYPNSVILIPTTGVYKVLFSAQCDSTGGTHYLEIFPVVNGTSVPDSNTRIRLPASTESCLTVEYFLSFNANDTLQFYMVSDNTNARIVAITRGTGTPTIPNVPSIIVTIMRIA